MRELERFDADVRGELDTQDTIQLCSALDCCQEARKFARLDDEDCKVGRNRHVLYTTHILIDNDEIEPGLTVNDFHNQDNEPEISDITGAQVLLSLEGISQKVSSLVKSMI